MMNPLLLKRPVFCPTRLTAPRSRIPHPSPIIRPFSSSTLYRPRKDSQDKDSINTEATEYSKSGTDDAAARTSDAAFNPDITDPQKQERAAQGDGGVSAKSNQQGKASDNPLNVSPANPDVSKARGQQEGGAQAASSQKSSGGGSPGKGKSVS